MSLQNKVVILFGSGVIASGYAQRFAKAGAKLAVVSRGDSCERLKVELQQKHELPDNHVIACHADASNFEDIQSVYDKTEQAFSQIDIVINGSGGNQPEAFVSRLDDFLSMAPEASERMMAANYMSKRYSLQIFAGYLKRTNRTGSAVNITSMSGLQPLSKAIDYSAAYAAVENLTKSLAYLYGQCNLGRINNIAVGFTIGNQNRRILLNEDGQPTERAQEILAGTSQNRFLDAGEIASHVLYLADDDLSHAINGQTLCVDAGFNLIGLPGTAGYKQA